jgi:hypothetical protein
MLGLYIKPFVPGIDRIFLVSLGQNTSFIINFLDDLQRNFLRIDDFDDALITAHNAWTVDPVPPSAIREIFPSLKRFSF